MTLYDLYLIEPGSRRWLTTVNDEKWADRRIVELSAEHHVPAEQIEVKPYEYDPIAAQPASPSIGWHPRYVRGEAA